MSPPPAGFELFDHTADVGVRAWAPTLVELLEQAARGLYAAVGELRPATATGSTRIDVSAGDPAFRLRDYLDELLYLFESRRVMLREVREAAASGERWSLLLEMSNVDTGVSLFSREVKAVTYHELELTEAAGRFAARFILDI